MSSPDTFTPKPKTLTSVPLCPVGETFQPCFPIFKAFDCVSASHLLSYERWPVLYDFPSIVFVV